MNAKDHYGAAKGAVNLKDHYGAVNVKDHYGAAKASDRNRWITLELRQRIVPETCLRRSPPRVGGGRRPRRVPCWPGTLPGTVGLKTPPNRGAPVRGYDLFFLSKRLRKRNR